MSVCPVDAFREGANCLVIDPEVCIDCGLCVPECPVDAIFPEDDLPEKWAEYLEFNARLAIDWPVIAEQKDAGPEAVTLEGWRYLVLITMPMCRPSKPVQAWWRSAR